MQLYQNTPALSHLWVAVQVAGTTYLLTGSGLLLALQYALPMFSGAEYGPLVGLLGGGVGSLAGNYLAARVSGYPFDWQWCIALVLLCLLSSLASFSRRRRSRWLATICQTFVIECMAIALALTEWAWSVGWPLASAPSLLTAFAPGAILAVVVVTLALCVSALFVSRA